MVLNVIAADCGLCPRVSLMGIGINICAAVVNVFMRNAMISWCTSNRGATPTRPRAGQARNMEALMQEIRTETKDNGSWSQYIEVGTVATDAFGDDVFTRKGYAKNFPGLSVQRKADGYGAQQRTRWIIQVSDGFAYVIRRVTNPGGADHARKYQVLYTPDSQPQC
jgi:hypothetical protein